MMIERNERICPKFHFVWEQITQTAITQTHGKQICLTSWKEFRGKIYDRKKYEKV